MSDALDSALVALVVASATLIRLELAERRASRERDELRRQVTAHPPGAVPGGRRAYDPGELHAWPERD